MRAFIKILFLTLFVLLVPMSVSAQLDDIGGIGSIGLSKDVGRFTELSFEQEIRFDENFTHLNRTSSTLGVDFSLIPKMLKAQIDYDFLIYNKQFYEQRHRGSLGLSGQYKYYQFSFKLRSRVQMTYRDEGHKTYKINPKYAWRNKFECSYEIFGSPVKPYIAAEIFCPINSAKGFYMDGYRIELGTKYRVSYRSTLDFQLRFDQDIQQKNPKNILYGGVGWKYKFK